MDSRELTTKIASKDKHTNDLKLSPFHTHKNRLRDPLISCGSPKPPFLFVCLLLLLYVYQNLKLVIHVLLQNYQRKCAAWKLQAEWRGKTCKTTSILHLNLTILVITVHSVQPNSVIIKEFKVPLIVCFDLFTPIWLSLRLKKPAIMRYTPSPRRLPISNLQLLVEDDREMSASADSKTKCVSNSCPVTHQTLRQQGETGEDGHIHLADWEPEVFFSHCVGRYPPPPPPPSRPFQINIYEGRSPRSKTRLIKV